jgi:hypothetical protein
MKQSIEDRCDALFEKLVPSEGRSDTVEGEMIRAVCRIVIEAAVKVVVEYVEAHLNNTTPNTTDLLDCKSRYYHEDDPNEDEDEEW